MCHFPSGAELYTQTVKDPNKSCALSEIQPLSPRSSKSPGPAPALERGFCSSTIPECFLACYLWGALARPGLRPLPVKWFSQFISLGTNF